MQILNIWSVMNNYQPQVPYKPDNSLEAMVAEQVKATATIIDQVRRSQDIQTTFKNTTLLKNYYFV